jgi:endonuclease G
MKKLSLNILLFMICALSANAQTMKSVRNGEIVSQCDQHYPLGKPIVVINTEKVEKRSFYLCRTEYAVQFDPALKTPIWSAENLTAERISGAKEPRTDDFQPDPEVPGPAQATLNDYKGSHFDRGHMSPAADMRVLSGTEQDSIKAMSESFYLTNIVPQVGMNNNRGIWSDLEGQVRGWAVHRGQLLVVTGPVYVNGFQTIGYSKVAVPTYLFKVVLDPKRLEAIAFLIPNQQIVTRRTHNLDKGNPNYPQTLPSAAINCNSKCTIENFVVPISKVEQMTGLKFFSKLPENQRQYLVNQINSKNWDMHD